MIAIRPFQNRDIPEIISIWRSEPAHRALFSAVTPMLLEEFVFGRLYFDPEGFLLADQDGECCGFVHAAFMPDRDLRWVDRSRGMVDMLMVRPGPDEDRVAAELIQAGIAYLRRCGAVDIYGGAIPPYDPFYAGLYGGMVPAGTLQSDLRRTRWLATAGFVETGAVSVYQLHTQDQRPLVTRDLLLLRRQCRLETLLDPDPQDWWEANAAAHHDLWLFRALATSHATAIGRVRYSDIEPLACQWQVAAVELLSMQADGNPPTAGWDVYLLSESIKQLNQSGIRLVQWVIREGDEQAQRLAEPMGFKLVDRGVFRCLPRSG
ncbi:MAG: hypothetical protein KatS3mg110_4053 [Pirellulaceae bacterium]|nr:MAG: hypothetical protein KatS3mg110_4053 [Pirellulaceae bacterium]